MKTKLTIGIVLVVCAAAAVLMGSMQSVKEPSVAGAFYPAEQAALTRAVESYSRGCRINAAPGKAYRVDRAPCRIRVLGSGGGIRVQAACRA